MSHLRLNRYRQDLIRGALLFILVIFLILSGAQTSLAQGAAGAKGIKALDAGDCGILGLSCPPAASGRTIVDMILIVLNVALLVIGAIALAVIIWAGVTYIVSLGDESKVGKAKKTLLFAIVGLLVIGVAGIIVNVIINIF